MKYIIEVSDDEMEKIKNSHKALFVDVYGMMANIIKNGIPLDITEYERIVQEIGYRVMEDPEKNGVYIVSYEDSVRLLEWFNGKWFFYPSNPAREETGTIIAWMPLPQPYKAKRSDKE